MRSGASAEGGRPQFSGASSDRGRSALSSGRSARRAFGPEPAWEAARHAARSLSVLRGVLDDPAGHAWEDLIETVVASPPVPDRVTAAYGRLFTLLAAEVELSDEPLVGDAWQHHLVSRLLDDENPFSLKAERAAWPAIGPALVAQTRADLRALQRCHGLAGTAIIRAAEKIAGITAVAWDAFHPLRTRPAETSRVRMMRRIQGAGNWPALVRDLAAYFAETGVGLFGRHRAFRWVRNDGRGALAGVPDPDPVRLGDLIGYDLERQPVVDNTRQFVAGAPANNVLLYGDRGTGKSSTVKALLNEFSPHGLRLVEVAKEHLADYPEILATLRGRRERFILFVDDLSFEEHETQYKALKAALEGSLEARSDNVVVYATSNRRHLVTERFVDRQRALLDDDVHPEDAVQEKLSLADRFGIHAPFLIPDQDRYLVIIEGLAAQYQLRMEAEDLRRRGLLWAQWHNGRTCRTARQFIEALRGEAILDAGRSNSGAERSAPPD
jgi:uncharacterized protein